MGEGRVVAFFVFLPPFFRVWCRSAVYRGVDVLFFLGVLFFGGGGGGTK